MIQRNATRLAGRSLLTTRLMLAAVASAASCPSDQSHAGPRCRREPPMGSRKPSEQPGRLDVHRRNLNLQAPTNGRTQNIMSVRSRVAAAAVSLGALGVAGPVAASSAATVPVAAGANLVAPIVSTNTNAALAAWTNGSQTAQAELTAGTQAAVAGWQVGAQAAVNGWLTGMQAAQAGVAAGVTAVGLPAGP
jgi:hypothetical protein